MNTKFRGISLRQVTEGDMPYLFKLFSDPERCHLWMCSRRVHDEDSFRQVWAAWTAETMAAKFIVESAGRAIGFVFDHDRTLEDGNTQVTGLLEEDKTGHGGGIIAAALLFDWLFRTVPLRKVYLKVFGYNPVVVRMLRKLGLDEEGVLKGDRYWNGRYWNIHIFALHREKWPALRARLLRIPEPRKTSIDAAPCLVDLEPPGNFPLHQRNGRPAAVCVS